MRRTFKAMLAAALILAAASTVLSAELFAHLSDGQNAINESRVDINYRTCVEQNHRHDVTLAKLDSLIAQIRDPVQRARAKRGASGSKALIEALAPHQDCRALVRRRFGPDAKPK
jgi:hypothetical protein